MIGKSLARHHVVEYSQARGTSGLPPVPFADTEDLRPLAGIKVIEIARVNAALATGAGLAALGAEAIAIQSTNLSNLAVRICLHRRSSDMG